MANDNQELQGSLILTLVRHGESADNVKPVWAGHRDASLSNFGHSQAVRLGDFFRKESFHSIFCSDLKRANLTANQILQQNLQERMKATENSDRRVKEYLQDQSVQAEGGLKVTQLLREQYFGRAEGQRYDTGEYTSGQYYSNRAFKFQDGESREDVKNRAQKFINQVLVPEYKSKIELQVSTSEPIHFCIVSHGIFLSELIGALNDLVGSFAKSAHPDHFSNTGWTRIRMTTHFNHNELESWIKLETLASNQVSHLIDLKRQPGGIGSAPWDPKQSNLDSFFARDNIFNPS